MKKILTILIVLVSISNYANGNDKPNVIFVLADDLGYSDLSCYGSGLVKTPNLDNLAANGLQFTNYRTAASICSPSRAAILTGAYPQRCGLYMGISPKREAHWFLGLDPLEITIAEQFKLQEYSTMLVGKWHLGEEEKFSFFNQGFDNYYGMQANYAHNPKFYDGHEVIYKETPLELLTELYTTRIQKYIREHAEKPFFLYYSHNYPHTPYKAGNRFVGSSKDGVRGDVIQEFDWSIGEILKTLETESLLSNTIIVFTSDNGPVNNKYAQPFRGTKYVSFEGGHRVPLIIYWEDGTEIKGVEESPVFAMDFFPTFTEIIGGKLPTGRKYDGISFLPLLKGEVIARNEETPFYYYNCENLQAVGYKNWKLHLPREKRQIPFWDKNKEFFDCNNPVLYDLQNDIVESVDVAAQNPEVVKSMLKMAKNARKELGEFGQRGKGQRTTGTLFPEVPIVSHPKDWINVPKDIKQRVIKEFKNKQQK